MKNRNKTAFMAISAIFAMIFLAACGSRAEETMASGEMAVPEMSSEEILVSSIEFLLRDDEVEEEEKTQEDNDPTADLQETSEQPEDPGKPDETQTVQDEEALENEAVIYYGNGASSELSRKKVEVKDRTPEEVLKALAKYNIVSLDTKLLAYEEEERNGDKILHIDLSKAAGEYLGTMSMEAESIIISSVINTFLENFDADAIRITVAGKPLTSSHRVYEEEMVKCTPGELLSMIKADKEGDSGAGENEKDSSTTDGDAKSDSLPDGDAEVEDGSGADGDTDAEDGSDTNVDVKKGSASDSDAEVEDDSVSDSDADVEDGSVTNSNAKDR